MDASETHNIKANCFIEIFIVSPRTLLLVPRNEREALLVSNKQSDVRDPLNKSPRRLPPRLRAVCALHPIPNRGACFPLDLFRGRSEEHTSELQSLMRISYAVFCLNKKINRMTHHIRRPKFKK